MKVHEIIWLDAFVEKLRRKHHVFYVLKAGGRALVISARDMKAKERRQCATR